MLIYTILSQIALHLSFLSFSVLYFFFSLNKIALHLSVNILIKFSFFGQGLKVLFFFYFIFFGWWSFILLFVSIHFWLWNFRVGLIFSPELGSTELFFVEIAAAPHVQVQPNVSQPTSLIFTTWYPLHLLYWLIASTSWPRFCFVFLFYLMERVYFITRNNMRHKATNLSGLFKYLNIN